MDDQKGSRIGEVARRVPSWAIVVFGLALAARLGVVVAQLELGLFDMVFESADTIRYRTLAESLREGRYELTPGESSAFETPGYPAFLAALSFVSTSPTFIAIVQSVLGAGTAVLLGGAAARLGGVPAAWGAGIGAALYPHLLFWTGYVISETLYVAFIALGLYLVARAADASGEAKAWVGAGIALGAAALTRPQLLGLVVAGAAVAMLWSRWRRPMLIGLAGCAVVVAPWLIRNAIVFERPVMTTKAGYLLWQGNSPGATGGSRGYVDLADFRPLTFRMGVTEDVVDRTYTKSALSWMRDNPGRMVALAPRKLWNMFRPTYEGSSALNVVVTVGSYLPVLVLSAYGLVLGVRRGFLGWVLFVFVAYHLVFHAVVTGMIRFRLPVEAALLVAAGVAVGHLWERRLERLPRREVGAAAGDEVGGRIISPRRDQEAPA